MMELGVNIDHIAVLREARQVNDPDPLQAVYLAKDAGADQITIHLREDRRHINEWDVERIIQNSPLPVNIECSIDKDIVEFLARVRPQRVTIVPEKREELTTEGGLNLTSIYDELDNVINFFKANEVEVSLFIDSDCETVKASKILGAEWVEFHTGEYANLYNMLHSNLIHTPHSVKQMETSRKNLKKAINNSLKKLENSVECAKEYGLRVASGHGLNYQNVQNIVMIEGIEELNIGQSIVARSVFSGFESAVREMKKLLS
jgi:pyridoxine 5-phosphate synthase